MNTPANRPQRAAASARPVLIGGDGRSGTTLLSVVLDSHPDLAVGPELHFSGPPNLGPYLLRGLELIARGDPRLTEKGIKLCPEWKSALRFTRRAERFGVDQTTLTSLVQRAIRDTASDLETFPDRCELITLMGQHIADRKGASRWGMKLMRAIKNLPKHASVWPEAHFIHIVRDGRDVAASQILEHSSWGYGSVDDAAERWNELVLKVHGYVSSHRLIELRYEDLVAEPRSTLERLVHFLDVSWSDDLLRHHEAQHAVMGATVVHPSKAAISRPINSGATKRYLRDLTPEQVAAFDERAADALALHGYR